MATKQPQQKEKTPQKQATQPKQNAVLTPFIFDQSNYIIMIAGVLTILLGFWLMSGGATKDPAVFPKEELYSTTRIVIAPIVVMIGFGIEIYAILKRPNIG